MVFCDTGCEFPWVRSHAYYHLSRVAGQWDVHVVSPDPPDLFWQYIFQKGYPPPSPTFRWHTRRVLVNPVRRFLERLKPDVVVMGSRLGELPESKRKYYKSHLVNNAVGTGYHNPTKIPAVFPVATFSAAMAVHYLDKHLSEPWFARLYRLTSDILSEYGSVFPRSGCWLCRDRQYIVHFALARKYRVFPAEKLWDYASWFWSESSKPVNRVVDGHGHVRGLSRDFCDLARRRFEDLVDSIRYVVPGFL